MCMCVYIYIYIDTHTSMYQNIWIMFSKNKSKLLFVNCLWNIQGDEKVTILKNSLFI